MRFITMIIVSLLVLPVFGQRKKDEAVVVPTYKEGIAYALPQTGIRVWVVAKEEVFIPGPFASFADELLGIPDAKAQATSSWAMEKVHIEAFAVPDPEKVFKALGKTASLISLSPNGCIAGINTPSNEGEKRELVTNLLLNQGLKSSMASFTNFSETTFYVPGDSTNNFRPTRISMEQKAAEAAAKIMECRTARFETAAGLLDEFHPDGEAYKQSLGQLKEIELEYLSLFIGKTKSKVSKYSFEYVPTKNTSKGEVLFRFSGQNGVLDKTDLAGKPVMLSIKKMDALTSAFSGKVASDNPNAGASGVYYNMPGLAEIVLSYELKPIANSRLAFGQFGMVAPVPEAFLDGKYSLEFHPGTGAIKNIKQK